VALDLLSAQRTDVSGGALDGAVSSDGSRIATTAMGLELTASSTESVIVLRRGRDGAESGRFRVGDLLKRETGDAPCRALEFVEGGGLAFVAPGKEQAVVLLDTGRSSAKRLGVLADDGDPRLVSAGKVLAAVAGHRLAVWSTTDTPPRTLTLDRGGCSLAFDREGRRLAVGCVDGRVLILDDPLVAGAPVELKGGHGGPTRTVAFTPEGARLLSGSDDGTIIVWGTALGEPLVSLNMESPVLHLCFPGGKERGVAVMRNGAVRYLDVRP
jgi:WD40 repeat protein